MHQRTIAYIQEYDNMIYKYTVIVMGLIDSLPKIEDSLNHSLYLYTFSISRYVHKDIRKMQLSTSILTLHM